LEMEFSFPNPKCQPMLEVRTVMYVIGAGIVLYNTLLIELM
jgi:hypothetical protein